MTLNDPKYEKGSYGLEAASTLRVCLKMLREDDVRISNGRLFRYLIVEKRNGFFMPITRT